MGLVRGLNVCQLVQVLAMIFFFFEKLVDE